MTFDLTFIPIVFAQVQIFVVSPLMGRGGEIGEGKEGRGEGGKRGRRR